MTEKPNLKICGNHIKTKTEPRRVWNNYTALRDGKGWYISGYKPLIRRQNPPKTPWIDQTLDERRRARNKRKARRRS